MTPSELARIYDAHASGLFAFLLNLTRDPSCTADVLQEVFLRLAQRPSLLDGVRDERAFLLRLSHNLAVDMLRRLDVRRRTQSALAAESLDLFVPGPEADDPEVQRQIAVAMGELPADQRAVVHLKIWEGLTFDAIAELLEIPLNTAASRYRYGLSRLRDRLRPLQEEIL